MGFLGSRNNCRIDYDGLANRLVVAQAAQRYARGEFSSVARNNLERDYGLLEVSRMA